MAIGTQIDFNDRNLLGWDTAHTQSSIHYRSMIISTTGDVSNAVTMVIDPSNDPAGRFFARANTENNTGDKSAIRIPIEIMKHGDSFATTTQDEIFMEFTVKFVVTGGGTIGDATGGGPIQFFTLIAADGLTEVMSLLLLPDATPQWRMTVGGSDFDDTSGLANPAVSTEFRFNVYYKANPGGGTGRATVWVNGAILTDLNKSHSEQNKVAFIDLESTFSVAVTGGAWVSGTSRCQSHFKYISLIKRGDYDHIDGVTIDINNSIVTSGPVLSSYLEEAFLGINGDAMQSSFTVNINGNPDGFRQDWHNDVTGADDLRCNLEFRAKGDITWILASTVSLEDAHDYKRSATATGLVAGTTYEWRLVFFRAVAPGTTFISGFVGETVTLNNISQTYRIMYTSCENQSGLAGRKIAYQYALNRSADMCFHLGDRIYANDDSEGFGPASTESEFHIAWRSGMEDRWFCKFGRSKPIYQMFDDRDFGENNWDASYRFGYSPTTGLVDSAFDGTGRADASVSIATVTKGTLYDTARTAWFYNVGSGLLGSPVDFGSNEDWFNKEQYRTFTTSRMRLSFLDTRTFADRGATQVTSAIDVNIPTGPKVGTRLGTTQREWINTQFANNSKDFTLLMSTVGWTDVAAGEESWNTQAEYISERNSLADTFEARSFGQLAIISGDTHIPLSVGSLRFTTAFGHSNTARFAFETIAGPLSENFSSFFNANFITSPTIGADSTGVLNYNNLGGLSSINWVRSFSIIEVNESTGNIKLLSLNAEDNTALNPSVTDNVMASEIPSSADLGPVNWEELLGPGTFVPGSVDASINTRRWWHAMLAIRDQQTTILKTLTTIDPANINSNNSSFISAKFSRCGTDVPAPVSAFDPTEAFTPNGLFFAQGGTFLFRPSTADLINCTVEINSKTQAQNVNNRRIFSYYVMPSYNIADITCNALVPTAIDPRPYSLTQQIFQSVVYKIPLMPNFVNIGCCQLALDVVVDIDPYTGLPVSTDTLSAIRECNRFYYIDRVEGIPDTIYTLFSFDVQSLETVNRGEILWQDNSNDIFIHDITWDSDNVLWALYDNGIRTLTIGDGVNNSFALITADISTSGPILDLFPIGDNNSDNVGRAAMSFNINNDKLYIFIKEKLWEFQKIGENAWELQKKSATTVSNPINVPGFLSGGLRDIAFSITNEAFVVHEGSLAKIDFLSPAGQGFGDITKIVGSADFSNTLGLDFVGNFGNDPVDLIELYSADNDGKIYLVEEELATKSEIISASISTRIIGIASCVPGENLQIPPQPWNPRVQPWIFMIDASASMLGGRMAILKDAFDIFVDNFVNPGDVLTIMTFGAPPIGNDVVSTPFGGYWGPFPIGGGFVDSKTEVAAKNIVRNISPLGEAPFCEALSFVRDNDILWGGTKSVTVFSDGAFSGTAECNPLQTNQQIIDGICNNIWEFIGGPAGHSQEAIMQAVGISPAFNGQTILEGISSPSCGNGGFTLWIP